MLVKMNQLSHYAFITRNTIENSSDQYKRIITIVIMAMASLTLIWILIRDCFSFKAKRASTNLNQARIINVLEMEKEAPNVPLKLSPESEKFKDRFREDVVPSKPRVAPPKKDEALDQVKNIIQTPIELPVVNLQNDDPEQKGMEDKIPSKPKIVSPQIDKAEEQKDKIDQAPADLNVSPPPATELKKSEDSPSELQELDIDNPLSLYDHAMTLKPKEALRVGKEMMTRQEILSRLIYNRSDNPNVYYQFGLCLKENGEASNENKTAQQECFAEAIRLNPKFAEAFCELGTVLADDATVKLSEEEFTKQGLLVKAIHLDQGLAKAYWALGMTLKPGTNFLLNDKDMNQQELFVEAVAKDPADGEAYYLLACIPGIKEITVNGVTLSRTELLEKASTATPPIAKAFYELGLIEKDITNKQRYFLKALKLQANLAEAYCELGMTLKDGEFTDRIQLHDGSTLDQQSLYLKAIDVNNAYGKAYYLLSTVIEKEDRVKVNGVLMTQNDLLVEATKAKLPHAMAFYVLGRKENDPAKKKQHYLQAIALDPNLAEAYCALGATLKNMEKIDLGDKKGIDQRELFRIAIQLNDGYGEAYYRLAVLLGAHDSITLLDGTVIAKKALYLKSIEITPQFAPAYVGLADMLGIESTEDISGRRVNRQTLYGNAIEYDEAYVEAYYKLAQNLREDNQQTINGISWTQSKVCQKIIELEKTADTKLKKEDLGRVYLMLAHDQSLSDGKTTIKVPYSEPMNRNQLIHKAKELGAHGDEFVDFLEEDEMPDELPAKPKTGGFLSYLNPSNWF